MELSIERTEESFKQPEIIKSEDFEPQQQQVEEEIIETSEIEIPVEEIKDAANEIPIVINLQEKIVTEKKSLNEIIPVTLKNETGLDCSSLSPICGQGLDIVSVVSLNMEDFKKLDDQRDNIQVLEEQEEEEEDDEAYDEEHLYDDLDENESSPVKTLDSSTIVLDDDDDDDDEDEDGIDDDEIDEEEEEDESEEDDSDIEEIQSSPIKNTPNDYDPMEGTSSNIQGDWDRWRIKKKKELEEAALIEARPIPMTMKPRKRTFLQRIKKRSIKW